MPEKVPRTWLPEFLPEEIWRAQSGLWLEPLSELSAVLPELPKEEEAFFR